MDCIVETDLGRDPDDFFALCYLVAAGVNIRAITISPGDKDQISVAKFILARLGLSHIPVGSAKPDREKSSVGGVHVALLKKYGWPERMQPDGFGPDVLKTAFEQYPDAQLFCIGPLQSVGPYLRDNPDRMVKRAVMQGGFAGYHLYRPQKPLEKFEGLVTCPTFNLGGDKRSSLYYVQTGQIEEKWFVGKNVCHSVVYTPDELREHYQWSAGTLPNATPAQDAAYRLFLEAMQLFFDRGAPHKAFHDPLAACLMLHPEIGLWLDGTLYYEKGQWGTKEGGPHKILADIDRNLFWQRIFSGT